MIVTIHCSNPTCAHELDIQGHGSSDDDARSIIQRALPRLQRMGWSWGQFDEMLCPRCVAET